MFYGDRVMTLERPGSQWGRNLAELRKLRGYRRQIDLATALGVTKQAVTAWESGKARPRDAMKARIAHVLGVEVSLIFPIAPEAPRG